MRRWNATSAPLGAVEIAGAKWCGKTWCARRHAQSIVYVDENLDLAAADPSAMLIGAQPHVIDEWQRVPRLWDVVRHEVDKTRGLRGAYILIDSSFPFSANNPEKPQHSGAGRIGRVRMHPMSLSESSDSTRAVSLAKLFEGEFESAEVETSAEDIAELACRGGWPEAIDMPADDAQEIAREYLRLFREKTVVDQRKDPETMRRLLFSLARNLGQATTYQTLLKDMADPADDTPSITAESTLASYLELLRDSYLMEEIPGWVPPARSRKRTATKPKRYLADPALAAAQLGLLPQALLPDWQTCGLLFENLCIRDLEVYAEAQKLAGDVPVRYYRDDSGLEADAIVELADGRWAAFEIEASESKVSQGADSLKRLRKKLCGNPQAQVRPPEFMAVITGVSRYAHRVEDGIYAIPIRALTA
ncbi:MAG: ATP-binding protein [Atopobiaceae bacterium]